LPLGKNITKWNGGCWSGGGLMRSTSKFELFDLRNTTMPIASQRQRAEEIQVELDELSPFVIMRDVEPPMQTSPQFVANQNDATDFLFLNGTCG
jgi:hypothetical protein